MNNLSGGYIMVDLASPNRVKQLEKAAALNKPLLVYYADGSTEWGKVSVTYETVDDVDIPTYHITTANGFVTVKADGDVSARPTFIEGDGMPLELEGFTSVYCKWSLSGTHLMLVLAGNVANATTLPASSILATFDLPLFIYNKVYAVWAGKYIESKTIQMFADNWGAQNIGIHFGKSPNVPGKLFFEQAAALTLTSDKHFRVQFDLVIDNE